MSEKIFISIDGVEVEATPGQTILQAADEAGIYIPRLCAREGLSPHGSCRVCSVKVNGRFQAACTQPVAPAMAIQSETDEVNELRRSLVEMLFVEGNHYCMFCEKSGMCELQAMAYRLGIAAPRYPYLFPQRDVDASHPEIFVDHNRCILCGRCVRASKEQDGKNVFQFVGRGDAKRVAVNSEKGLAGTDLSGTDAAAAACPVGAINKKGEGFAVPVGERMYDHKPIGTHIEAKRR